MNGRYLLDKMEGVSPEYIEAAENAGNKGRRQIILIRRLTAALAACLALAVLSGVMLLTGGTGEIDAGTLSENTASVFGSGGLTAVLFAASLLAAAVLGIIIAVKKKKGK